ncbi:thermonuclease family protein [uncultured Cohaesibacter sp.]|uniref:thermonuclease family protein n=1 Tax=uncultured Cohaesibacter sp. TaxID=1002546 RepID=UPI0029313C5F|nr:thermonuclease family protein [uncultured Cohaesibacter sp.]
MTRIGLFIFLLFVACPSVAMPICGQAKRITCVVDGDTFWFGGVKYRLHGVDTPETDEKNKQGRELARKATIALRDALSGHQLYFLPMGKDRFGRSLVRVWSDGQEIGPMLINNRLAREWPDGERWWRK